MTRAFAGVSLIAILSCVGFGQAAESAPKFDLADVHASAKASNPYMSGGVLRGGRYDLRNATMVDLIRTAYSIDDNSRIQGGPAWLDTDRFDIVAKAPQSTSPESVKLMLQALLADRFKLVVHIDTKPMPVFALLMGKGKPKMKESDGKGPPGCQGQPQNPAPGEIPYTVVSCHGMSMETFAPMLRGMAPAYVTDPSVDQTGLKGSWDFDIKWTGKGGLAAAGSDGISMFDAIDKQLGLKLEAQKIAMSVVVVDSAKQKPTDNPPGVTASLPPPPPAEFEVAEIRPSRADETPNGRLQPGGRLDLQALPLRTLINLAWNFNSDDMVVGPKFLDSAKFDVLAKVSTAGGPANAPQIDIDDVRLMMRALLVDRFKMKVHMEDRPVSVYTLTAVKPKLQKADPSNRSGCKEGPGPDGKDPRIANPVNARLSTCLNMTMAQLAEQFQNIAGGYIRTSVVDATGIEGAYDVTLNFAPNGPAVQGGAAGQPAGGAAAAEPNGALSLFDAVNKQLGLKLEMQKRPIPVLIIDHIEEKPADN